MCSHLVQQLFQHYLKSSSPATHLQSLDASSVPQSQFQTVLTLSTLQQTMVFVDVDVISFSRQPRYESFVFAPTTQELRSKCSETAPSYSSVSAPAHCTNLHFHFQTLVDGVGVGEGRAKPQEFRGRLVAPGWKVQPPALLRESERRGSRGGTPLPGRTSQGSSLRTTSRAGAEPVRRGSGRSGRWHRPLETLQEWKNCPRGQCDEGQLESLRRAARLSQSGERRRQRREHEVE